MSLQIENVKNYWSSFEKLTEKQQRVYREIYEHLLEDENNYLMSLKKAGLNVVPLN